MSGLPIVNVPPGIGTILNLTSVPGIFVQRLVSLAAAAAVAFGAVASSVRVGVPERRPTMASPMPL